MTHQTTYSGRLARGARTQARVLGALIIREMQTRFGRDNIGFLWLFVEPMLLMVGVSILQRLSHVIPQDGVDPIPFTITGYCAYMMFRSNVTRAAVTVLSNRVLMYHRQVTMFDILLARTLLELGATFIAMLVLLAGCVALGFGPVPARPLMLIAGMLTMFWFSTGIAMMICAAGEFFPVIERFVHPTTYLILPFSGMLFRIEWLPQSAREILRWAPLPQITEIIRQGVWSHLHSDYVDPPYLIMWCAITTLLGLLGLNVARQAVRFE